MSNYYEVDIDILEDYEYEVGVIQGLTGLSFPVIEFFIASRKRELGFLPDASCFVASGLDYHNYLLEKEVKKHE